MSEQQTCGKGLAARAALPLKLSELAAAMAEIFAYHQGSVGRSDPNGAAELQLYAHLEKEFRVIAKSLRSVSHDMTDARELPMAQHDVAVLMSAENRTTLEIFIDREREIIDLVQKFVHDDKAILAQMRGK